MRDNFLRILAGIVAVTLFLEVPAAYALFGARVARRVVAARRAEKAAVFFLLDFLPGDFFSPHFFLPDFFPQFSVVDFFSFGAKNLRR